MSYDAMDMMSSPDPLNASLQDAAPMSSRRVTRSQSHTSSRLSSVNPSPRKQTFALDVGNGKTPQKIFVTVEADDRHNTDVKRKLFQSPTPRRVIRRREKTTTTVVPLKGLTDDESGSVSGSVAPTPKRRGRPPKAAGTPAATAKKRATPIRKTPARRMRGQSENLVSDISVEDNDATPKPTRTRTGTKRKNATPAAETADTPKPKRRGRPRKAMIAEEIIGLAGQAENSGAEVGDNASVAATEDSGSVAGSYASAPPSSHGGDDGDIWMATLSDPPTQYSRRESVNEHRESSVNWPTRSYANEQRETSVNQQRESSVDEQELPMNGANDQQQLPSVEPQSETDNGSEANVEYGLGGGHSEADTLESDGHDNSGDKDTIMVQEEFTMISIHSLPSMQGNLSIAASQHEIGEETSLIINNTLESLRQSRTETRPKTPYEDEVSFVGPSPVKASPEKISIPTNDSMFSQSTSGPAIRPSPRRAKVQDLGRQLALKSLQKQQDPESPQNHTAEGEPIVQETEEESMYDDSFSEIPEAVLDAATPRPVRQALGMSQYQNDSFSEIPEAVLEAATPKPLRRATVEDTDQTASYIQQSIEQPSRVNPPNPQSESNRLLTPDETPSPVMSEHDEEKAAESATEKQSEWEIQSSPPVLNVSQRGQSSAGHPSRRASSETPAQQMTSSRSPPRIEVSEVDAQSLAPPDGAPRPTVGLSPIVRAGRALQMVTSDPPSPPGRSPSLGSPFRASVSKSPAPSMAATQPALAPQPTPAPQPAQSTATTQEQLPVVERQNSPWSSAFAPFKQIKNLVSQGARAFSPKAAPSPAVEDPFVVPATTKAAERQDTLALHNSMFSLGGGSMDQASRTSSVQAEVAYEDEMSWQADETPAPRMDDRPASASSTMRGKRGSEVGDMSDVDMESLVEQSFVEQDDEEEEQADDFDDDIWAVEAQRPTPGRPQARVQEREEVLNPPRRSKLPSPWRQNSKRLVYSDELHKLADKDAEISLFSQFSDRASEAIVQPARPPPKKVDLSAFFSSPALLPEVMPPGVSFPKPAHRFLATEPETRPFAAIRLGQPAERLLARKEESQPVPRRIFSFGGRSSHSQPILGSTPSLPSVPQKQLQIGTQRRADLFSPVKPSARREPEAVEHSSSPSTPPQQLFAHVPQKENFTPRSAQTSKSLFDPLPSGRPTTSLSIKSAVTFSAIGDETEASLSPELERSSPTQDSSFIAPLLKPLPSRAQSPTKSCIRSPVKPKTPGRVVDFTSSVLSPLAQAQARAEQRASSSPQKTFAGEGNKENGSGSLPPTTMDLDKPTASKPTFLRPNDITHLPPPSATPSNPAATRLSTTSWTRTHWERLDLLLQQRRRSGALAFQLAHPATNKARPKLLGKQVVAQGQTMTLEQWHLDVVDAFAAEVGGAGVWDERTLAKRVFALLVGEERRARGEVDRGAREGRVGFM